MQTDTVAEKKFVLPKKTKYVATRHTAADHAMREQDRVLRWKKVYKLLRTQNKAARKEQDKVAIDCASVRADKIFKTTPSKTMGLRFGVAMPPMTWRALIAADRLVYGRSDLVETDKEEYSDLKGSNKVVQDLSKAFPQFKVTK